MSNTSSTEEIPWKRKVGNSEKCEVHQHVPWQYFILLKNFSMVSYKTLAYHNYF
jgi:hypothetical protein